MAFDSEYTEFSIKGNPDPAIASFRRMELAYKDTLVRMSNAGGKYGTYMEGKFKAIKSSAKNSATSMSKEYTNSFSLMKTAARTFTSALTSRMAQATISIANSMLMASATFETGLAQISTLLDKSVMPAMGSFRDQLIEISVTGDQTLKTLTAALYQTISAGITSPKEAIALVREADIAATAGLAKTGEAVRAFVTVINAWGRAAGTTQEVNDLLFMTVKRGVTTFPELSKSLGNVAAVAATAGVSTQETMAAFTALTKAGLNSQTAMTYLKNTIVALLKPSRGSADVFKKLGIEIGENAIRQRGLIGIMEQVKEKTGGNSDVMVKLFGNIRSLQGAMVLAGDGFKTFSEDLTYMKNAAGASKDAFDKMADTWKFQSDQFKNITNVMMIKTFDPFFDGLKEHFKNLNFWLKGSGENFKQFGEMVGGVLKTITNFAIGVVSVWKQLSSIGGGFVSDVFKYAKASIDSQLALLKLPFSAIIKEGEDASHRLTISRKLEAAQAEQNKAAIESLTQTYLKNIEARKKMNAEIAEGLKASIGRDPTGKLKQMIEAKAAAEIVLARAGGKKKKGPSAESLSKKDTIDRTRYMADSVKIFLEGRKRLDAAMRVEGDEYQRLEEKYSQYVERYGFSTHLKAGFDRWYIMEKAKIDAKKKAQEEKEEKRLDDIVRRTQQKQSDAIVYLEAIKGKSKRSQATYLDIVFGSDEELQQRFGKKLALIGSNVQAFRETIATTYSPGIITNAGVWWAQFTKTGKVGAEGFVNQVKQTMSSFVTGLSDMWMGFWEKMVTGPKDATKEIVPALLDLIGNMAAGWASYFAAMVPGLIATYQYPQAAAAAAAALALGAVAGIAKGGAAALRNANNTTTAAGAGGASKAQDAFKASQQSDKQQPTIINMHMGFIAPPNQRQAEYVAEVVSDALGRSRNKVGGQDLGGK
jgi:TP901 family phage tail tape measure protein